MGSHVFTWEHPANEVFVTGTFDNWSKSEKLTKRDEGHFDKTVHFKSDHDRILYKFVVDGNWTVNHTLPQLEDGTGNVNNVLYPHEITPAAGFAALSNVAPGSTTALLAGATPKESSAREAPGAFPETPAFETPSATENSTFFAAPIPASTGMGNPVTLKEGEAVPHPSTLTSNTIGSNVKLDKESYEHADRGVAGPATTSADNAFTVAPLPATGGIHNPVTLKEGEAVPHPSTLTSNTIGSNVKLDKESYEHADRGVAGTSADKAFTVPPVTSSMIPESSLPMGSTAGLANSGADMFTQSAGANSSTALLAGSVPLEPRGKATIIDDDAETVPAIVTDSQKSAHVDPEASGNSVALEKKNEMENELLKSGARETPASFDNSSVIPSSNQISTAAVGGMVAAGAAISGAAIMAKSYLPASIQESINKMNSSTSTSHTETPADEAHTVADKTAMERESESKVAPAEAAVPSATTSTSIPVSSVPNPVKESLSEAHADPEAASNEKAVQEKSTMERELQSKLARDDSVGESAPVIAPSSAAHSSTLPSPGVPQEVKNSLNQARASPEAAAYPKIVQEKSAVEKELTSKISPVMSAGEPAPTVSAATTSTSPLKQADATTLGALEGKSTDLGTAATLPPTESSHATPFALGAGGASAIAAGVVAAPVVHSFASKDSAGKSTPQVTTGIETTPTTVTTTGSSAPSTPSKKVTDPAAPVKDQGALKAANAASPVKTPTANRQSQDVGSPSSTHTDASGKKKKRFSVFMDKLKDKLR